MKTTKILPPDDTNPNTNSAVLGTSSTRYDARTAKSFSTTQWGLIVLALTLLLGITPWFLGLGWQWTIVLALGAFALWQSENNKITLPNWFAPLFVLVVVAQAFRVLDLALIPALWLVSAVLLSRGVWQQSKAHDGFANRLKPRNLLVGHRVWILLGCALSLGSMGLTWGRTPDLWSFGWMGGMQSQMQYTSSYSSYSGQYEYSYQPTMTYNPTMYMNNYWFPGLEYSGRWQPQATWAIVALLFVLCWSMLKRDAAAFKRGGAWAIGALMFCALWWFGLRNDQPGPRWFLVGLLMTAFGVWKLRKGEDSGAHDPKTLLTKLKTAKKG